MSDNCAQMSESLNNRDWVSYARFFDVGRCNSEAVSSQAYGFSVGLCDGFYQFAVAKVAAWFSMDFSVTYGEICDFFGHTFEVYDDDLQELVMAMGWSWALFFCHAFLSDVMLRAQDQQGVPRGLVADHISEAGVGFSVPASAPYVDNSNIIALTFSSGHFLHKCVVELLERLNFELHDFVHGTAEFNFLGMVLQGGDKRITHTPRRSWRLYHSLQEVLGKGGCTPDLMRILLGHITITSP